MPPTSTMSPGFSVITFLRLGLVTAASLSLVAAVAVGFVDVGLLARQARPVDPIDPALDRLIVRPDLDPELLRPDHRLFVGHRPLHRI